MDPLAESLSTSPVLDLSGKEIPLGDLFRSKPAALVFIRHFG